jgi:hypothetical protein
MHRMGVGLVGGVLAGLLTTGCGCVGASPQDYARRACDEYHDFAREPVATTAEQTSAIQDVARSDVRAAAAFDPRWATLSSDMQSALDLRESAHELDRFFEMDRRVQDDCSDAGRDIGDLKP